MKNIKTKILYLLILVLQTGTAIAAAKESDFSKTYYDIVALAILAVIILVFWGFFHFGMGEGKPVAAKKEAVLFKKIKQALTGATPIEKENDILLDHDYDGIKELDNRVPPWFSYLFYITILFAVYYLLDYHVLKTSVLQEDEYAMEVKEAEALRAELIKSGAFINEETVTLLTDDASLSSGKSIYTTNCVACHRDDGGGLIGPNLTDDFWIHGGGVKDVFKTIKYGVPAKGMISWQTQLNPRQMQEVTSFIFTIHGTKPVNPKAPEGNKYTSPDSTKTVAMN